LTDFTTQNIEPVKIEGSRLHSSLIVKNADATPLFFCGCFFGSCQAPGGLGIAAPKNC